MSEVTDLCFDIVEIYCQSLHLEREEIAVLDANFSLHGGWVDEGLIPRPNTYMHMMYVRHGNEIRCDDVTCMSMVIELLRL